MNSTAKKGMLRPLGVVAFAVLTGLLLLCFYWVAPLLIKQGIERFGTQLNGAKVEVANVDLSLSPAGLYLHGVQVTDARQPMENLVEISSAYAELDLFELWGGKVIIDDLEVDTLRFGTQRAKSGAVEEFELAEDASSEPEDNAGLSDSFAAYSMELPDADTVLNQNPLKTTQLATELESTFAAQKTQWEELSNSLPDDQRLDYYEEQFKALTQGKIDSLEEFNQRKKKFDALKQELEAEQARMVEAKDQLARSKKLIENGYQDLKAAPQSDFQSLKQKYSLDSEGGLNLTGLLFGDQFQSYASTALYWYQRLAPLMARDASDEDGAEQTKALEKPRGSGRFIYFGTNAETPDFMIRKARANAILSQGEVALSAQDLTHQQYLSGKPSLINAEASALNDVEKFDLRISLDHRSSDTLDRLSLVLKGQNLDDLNLSDSDALAVGLNKAQLDLNTDIELQNQQLQGELTSRFNNAQFTSQGDSTVAKELSKALEGVRSFSLDAALSGELDRPDFKVRSDLDRVLKDALAGRFEEKRKQWEGELKAALNQKLNTFLAKNEGVEGYFSDQGAALDGDLGTVNSLMETQLDSFVDAKSKEAEEELSNQVSEKLKGLF